MPSLTCTPTVIRCYLPRPGFLWPPTSFRLTEQRRRASTKKALRKWKHNEGFSGRCRADLSQDAPFAAAIGACILNSLVFPVNSGPEGEERGGALGSEDLRFGVMGVISFLPYFNWLSWVFAWLDTGRPRYLVYSVVYLAPYLRTNLSLSPEDSWLPVTSILLCLVHVQLEAESRARDGDTTPLREFLKLITESSSSLPVVNDVLKLFSKSSAKGVGDHDDIRSRKEEKEKQNPTLPRGKDDSEDTLGGWNNPRKPENEQWLQRNKDEEHKSD